MSAPEGTDLELDRHLQIERARADRAEREARRLRGRVQELERTLEEVYGGETFRLGERILKLPRRVKLLLRERRGRVDRPVTFRSTPEAAASSPTGPVLRLDPQPDQPARGRYQAVLDRRAHTATASLRIAMLVSTTDLDAGRGDLFTAIGLALALERLDASCVVLGPDDWYDLPSHTDVVVAMVCEPELRYRVHRCPPDVLRVAWVRNNTDRWVASGALEFYDGLLASSRGTADALSRSFDGPIEVLPIAVDPDLFGRASQGERRGVLATLNQWTHERPRRIYDLLASSGTGAPLAIRGVTRGVSASLEPYVGGPVDFFSLPSLYASVAVVLDDQQDTNRRFGNVNSRVFEALAAGALPLTGAPRGLADLGLEEVPTFDDAESLATGIAELLGDERATQDLVERLRADVLARHTYAARAVAAHEFIRSLTPRVVDAVAFLPDYTSTNPFQSLLYTALGRPAVPIDRPTDASRLAARGGDVVVHVHWTAPVLGPATSERDARTRSDRFLADLDAAREAGCRVAWTVHNVLPHETRYPDVERELRQGIVDRADVVHVMCERTIDEVAPHYRLEPSTTVVVPHPSYVDVYPNVVAREDARRELGLPPGARVFLFLGQIRPYKGVEDLLEAFEEVASRDASAHLVIAGKIVNHPDERELRARIARSSRTTAELDVVADDRLQVFLNAADVVVLPHRNVLNSGGALLAFSFGRPVVAPRAGCLPSMVAPEVGVLFDEDTSLARAMELAAGLDSAAAGRAAVTRARAIAPEVASARFAGALEQHRGRARGDGPP